MLNDHLKDIDNLSRFFRIVMRYSNAGLSVTRAVEQFKKMCPDDRFRGFVESVERDLSNGISFAEALKVHSDFCPSYISRLINVGESGGQLHEFFNVIVFNLKQEVYLKKEIRSGLRQPKLLLCGAIVIFLFVIFYLIPKMGEVLLDMKIELPFLTKLFLGIGTTLSNYWFIFFGLAVLLFIGYKVFASSNPVLIDLYKLRLPFFGPIYSNWMHYQICKTLSLCLKTGSINEAEAFRFAADVVDNLCFREYLLKVANNIETFGDYAYSAVKKVDEDEIFDDNFSLMLQAGFESGTLPVVLDEEAEAYREILMDLVKGVGDRVSSVIVVPIMIFVLVIMAAIYMPLGTTFTSINGAGGMNGMGGGKVGF